MGMLQLLDVGVRVPLTQGTKDLHRYTATLYLQMMFAFFSAKQQPVLRGDPGRHPESSFA